MKILFAIFFGFYLIGCSSTGFNRGSLREQVGIKQPVTTDAEIAKALKKKPNLPKPFKLAIYFSTPEQYGEKSPKWWWTQEDKDLIFNSIKELENKKVVSKVFPIISTLVAEEDLKSVRLAAANHGADALLIVSGITDIDRWANNWSWAYAFVLPIFFVQGSEAQGLFISTASMWDVRNEFLYLTAETEEIYAHSYPAALGDTDREIFNKVKTGALKKLNKQIIEMVQGR